VQTIPSVDGSMVLFIFYLTNLPLVETVWCRIVECVVRNERDMGGGDYGLI
jgi:hypothetical protein